MLPFLPSYPGWSVTWTNIVTIAIGVALLLLGKYLKTERCIAATMSRNEQRIKSYIAISPLFILLAIVLAKATIGQTPAYRNMLDEGGFVEYLTAISLFAASLIAGLTARQFWRRHDTVLSCIMLFYAAFLLVFWGEEVSWGQRVIGWAISELFALELPSFFQLYNVQEEFNLHNLVWVVPYMKLASSLVGAFVVLLALSSLWLLRHGSRRTQRFLRYSVPGWYLWPLFGFAALFLGVVTYCESRCQHTGYFGLIIPADSEIGECILAVAFFIFTLRNYLRQAEEMSSATV